VATRVVTVVELAPRYTLNPLSLLEASVQVRLMAELDATVAWRFKGAIGMVTEGGEVVELVTFDAADSPVVLYAVIM